LMRTQSGEHHSILTAKENLALTLHGLGDLEGAKTLREDVLDVVVRTMGAEHPNALTAKRDLALTLYHLGDLERAKKLQQEILDARVRHLALSTLRLSPPRTI